jgi:hypothetical protein
MCLTAVAPRPTPASSIPGPASYELSTEISRAQAAHGKPFQHQDALLAAYANRKETNDKLNAASGSGVEKRSILNTQVGSTRSPDDVTGAYFDA